MSSSLFGKRIESSCEYCMNGHKNAFGTILCKYKGVVEPYFSCKKFEYTPLKREPKIMPDLPQFSENDFKL